MRPYIYKEATTSIIDLQKITTSCQELGGFLTNFVEMKKKLKELYGLNSFLTRDSFQNLIKKEQVSLEKRRNKLQNIYEGVINLYQQPDALFIIGLNKEKTAFREAKKIGIPVIAVCNSNCNPRLVDYVIPGNDESVKSVTFFANLVADSIIAAKKGKELGEDGVDGEKNKNNLPPEIPKQPNDNPEPIPGDRKEEKNIIKGVNRKDWRVIYVSENHPEIKRLLRERKLQEKKQFTVRYGKPDKEENNF
ncbi:16113_t:CDS:2 [Entrophospora sp. SA101]|nr:16113_t:CDS:2 [Entrophospora sp. SA101]CAJ0912888.1 11105_t:CDS:2 [Entrophospora sp. SA101]